jgi:hypothetical protein
MTAAGAAQHDALYIMTDTTCAYSVNQYIAEINHLITFIKYKYQSAVKLMLLTLNLIRIEIGKICRGTVRSTDTTATGTEPRQA